MIQIDKLIRSHRRTVGLQITHDAKLIVRAPYRASEDYINKLVSQKEAWIKAKQKLLSQRPRLPKKFVPGEEFMLLGQGYKLMAVEELPKAVVFNNDLMISARVLANARDHLENWYKAQALDHISQRVDYFAQKEGLRYQSIKISSATTNWGSCGYKDTLNFSWRLVMAPPAVVDYVIIHELAHLKQKNHSRKFWAEVAGMMPDYRAKERWLKANGHLMAWVV